MQDFKQLEVWKKAIDFTAKIYQLTAGFPKSEVYGLSSQIQRASVSISCNISEGAGRSSKKDFNRFLEMAYGSANEVENLLIIAKEINLIKEEESLIYSSDIREIRKMLNGLIKSLTRI